MHILYHDSGIPTSITQLSVNFNAYITCQTDVNIYRHNRCRRIHPTKKLLAKRVLMQVTFKPHKHFQTSKKEEVEQNDLVFGVEEAANGINESVTRTSDQTGYEGIISIAKNPRAQIIR